MISNQNTTADSRLCKCNATFCDVFSIDKPLPGYVNVYTSNRQGLRLYKSEGLSNNSKTEIQTSKLMLLLKRTLYIYIDFSVHPVRMALQ